MNFCPGELILELLARIGEWHQNLSEKTVERSESTYPRQETYYLRFAYGCLKLLTCKSSQGWRIHHEKPLNPMKISPILSHRG